MSKSKRRGGRQDYYWPFLLGVDVPVKYFISRANPQYMVLQRTSKKLGLIQLNCVGSALPLQTMATFKEVRFL